MRTLIDPCDTQFKEYFKDCSIVMSAPNVAFLVGEHAVLRGIPSVVQAMPTRVYVGIKKSESSEKWLTVKTLDSDGKLRNVEVRQEDPNLVGIEHLGAFVKVQYEGSSGKLLNILNEIKGLAIRVLSDITPGSGADWSGAFSSALAACVHFGVVESMRNPQVICTDLNRWRAEWRSNNKFKAVNLFAFFLESAFHGGRASGYGNVASLLGLPMPVVYRTRRRYPDRSPYIDVYASVGSPLDWGQGTRTVIERLRQIAQSVEFIPLRADWLQCIYIAVIDTLKRKEAGTAGAITRVLDELRGELQTAGREVPKDLDLVDFDFSEQPDNIWFALDYYVLAFIYFFTHSLSAPSVNTAFLSKAIGYMNSVGNVLLSFGLGWKEFTDIRTRLLADPRINEGNTAVKLSGGGMAGVCTLVSTAELDDSMLTDILGRSDCILYSSDMRPDVNGLRLHKSGGKYLCKT